MRSDEEIERLLEDWLDDGARPMPHDVLENSLEAVSRTAQVGPRRGGRAWVRSRPMGLLAVAAVLILVATAGGLAVDRIGSLLPTESATAREPQIWDPLVDLGRVSNRLNPSPDSYGNPGVWTYMSSADAHAPFRYRPLPEFAAGTWSDPAFVNLHAHLAADGVVLHPFKEGETVRYIILAWTSPIAGEVAMRGIFLMADGSCVGLGSGISFSVDRESELLFASDIPTGGMDDFVATTTIRPGESIYFIVDPGTNSSCDSVRLTLEISLD